MTKISEIQLKELEAGCIVYNRRYKFILSSQEQEYLSMVLTGLFKYWMEEARQRPFTISQTKLKEFINSSFPNINDKKPCGTVGLKNSMQYMSPVFIEVYTRFYPEKGTFQRLYRTTPLLCEWFKRNNDRQV